MSGFNYLLLALAALLLSWVHLGSAASATPTCDTIDWVTRAEWGSAYPIGGGPLSLPVDYVFIHHAETPESNTQADCIARVQQIQDYHVNNNGWDDIGYNFLVCGDGRVYIGRDWDHVGAQTYGWNSLSEGICLIGNYMDFAPSPTMLAITQAVVQCGIEKNAINGATYGLYGHRDGSCTQCPGDAFYAVLASWSHWHNIWPITQNCAAK